MKYVPKIISMLFLWGVVVAMVIFVDPAMLKNIWLDDLYTPFLLSVLIASWYTMSLITGSGSIGFVSSLLVVLGMVLQLLKVFNWISGIAIVGTIISLSYFAIKRNGKDTLIQQTKVDKL